jgi:Ca2+-transporting ATPase
MFAGLSSVSTWVLGGTLLGFTFISGVPAIAEAFTLRQPSLPQGLLAFGIGAGMLFLFEAGKTVMRQHR